MNEAWCGRLAFELYARGPPKPLAALAVQVQPEKDDGAPCSCFLHHAATTTAAEEVFSR